MTINHKQTINTLQAAYTALTKSESGMTHASGRIIHALAEYARTGAVLPESKLTLREFVLLNKQAHKEQAEQGYTSLAALFGVENMGDNKEYLRERNALKQRLGRRILPVAAYLAGLNSFDDSVKLNGKGTLLLAGEVVGMDEGTMQAVASNGGLTLDKLAKHARGALGLNEGKSGNRNRAGATGKGDDGEGVVSLNKAQITAALETAAANDVRKLIDALAWAAFDEGEAVLEGAEAEALRILAARVMEAYNAPATMSATQRKAA